jgi:alpha-beta hydrolase superfamily lysophospholipase
MTGCGRLRKPVEPALSIPSVDFDRLRRAVSYGFLIRGPARPAAAAILATAWLAASAAGASPPDRLVVKADGQELIVWSRLPARAKAAVVLVHGRTWSARPAFDFDSQSVSRSLLRSLAAAGYATYAVDLPGYGSSARTATGWLSPTQAAVDVEAVVRFVTQLHRNLPPPALLGWSRGSKISALVATRSNGAISALVLYAFNFDADAPPLYGPAGTPAPGTPNTADAARSDFVSPKVASPELVRDFVSAALASDPTQAPVCCDVEFRSIRPESIRVPTLLIHGARDPAFRPAVASAFFERLATTERRWIIVAAGDHAAHLEDTAPEVTSAIVDFLQAELTSYAHD